MKTPQTLSLPVLPESIFGRLQVTTYLDGCIVVTIIQDEETDCLIPGSAKAFVGKSIQVGLNLKNSNKLRAFLAAEQRIPSNVRKQL